MSELNRIRLSALHWPHLFFLTMGWFGIQMAMALDASQFQDLLKEHIDHPLMIGVVLTLGPIAGITVQPAIGWWGDYLAKKGFGRDKFIKIGLVFCILSIIALSLPLTFFGLVSFIALFFVSINMIMVCYRATVAEISSRKSMISHKGTISGLVALFSGAGSFTMFALAAALHQTILPYWIAGFLFFLSFWFFFHFGPKPKLKLLKSQQPKIWEQLKTLNLLSFWHFIYYVVPFIALIPACERKLFPENNQKSIFRLFLVVFFLSHGIQALRGYFILYVHNTLHFDSSVANLLLAVLTLSVVGFSVPLGKLADQLDNRKVLGASLLLFTVVCLVGFYWVRTPTQAIVMVLILGAAVAGMIVNDLAILFKLCPIHQEGLYSGLYNLFLSTPQIYSLMITGWLIGHTNRYEMILMVGAISTLIGFILSFRLMPLPQFKQQLQLAPKKKAL